MDVVFNLQYMLMETGLVRREERRGEERREGESMNEEVFVIN